MSPRQSGVEVRSIDYVPLSERHGKLWHLGPLWFMGNAQIATLAVGVVGVEAGGNLFWSLVAILAGVLTGTFFMAFHSAQGPQLGLPQMIQSRPQFGYIGALLVWLFAYVQYAGFNVFNTILAGQAANETVGTGEKLGIVVATVARGRDRAHRLRLHPPRRAGADVHVPRHLRRLHDRRDRDAQLPAGALDPAKFDAVAVPHAVRRHRRLPDLLGDLRLGLLALPAAGRDGPRTFWWTYWGSGLGALWLMGIGALLAASAGDAFDAVAVDRRRRRTGSSTASGRSCCCSARVGLISVTALNLYGGSLTLISAMDSLRRVRPTLSVRVDDDRVHGGALARRRAALERVVPRRTSRPSCC